MPREKGFKWSPEQRAKFNARVGTLEDRFWRKVNKHTLSGCWEWVGSRTSEHYGQLWVGNTMKYAHRLSHEMHHGPVPPGMVVMHLCDNPKCVNPEHLQAGTPKDNSEDCVKKGRLQGKTSKRLSREVVLEIRERFTAGESHAQIARDLQVGMKTVRSIGLRQSRADVA